MSNKTKEKKKIFKGERTASTIKIIIGLILFLVTVIKDWVPVMTVILAALAAIAVFEVVRAVGTKNKLLYVVSCAVGAFSVLSVGFGITIPSGVLLSFYVLLLLSLNVFDNKNIVFTHTVTAFFASVAIPYAFSCFIRLNNIAELNESYSHYEGTYLVGLAFACSWITDSFAYLVGRKFGKHKMAPVISPKKSVEGAIGGIVVTAVFNVILLLAFDLIGEKVMGYKIFGDSAAKYLYIIPISMVLSFVSIIGDLAASVLKRNFGIKDYSQLLPGHGGIMDRFDSCTFVAPALYGIFALINFQF